jgi:sodium-dependent dicarboxylate transporter 2/3/5
MSSNTAAAPAVGLSWNKYLFMAIGIILFAVVYYSPPWPDAIDPQGKAFSLSPEGKGALAVFLLGYWFVKRVKFQCEDVM